MTVENRLSAPKRRTRAEVQRLVAEFVSSGMRRSEFCRSRGLSFGTLDRHLKKRRWRGKKEERFFSRPVGAGGVGPQEKRRPSTDRVVGCS
jgi:DNA invertase Pin-like site-specific DNA recombinase